MKSIFFLPLIFFFSQCKSQPVPNIKTNKDNNTLFWEISGNGLKQPSYLFGTFHMMCKDDIKFSLPLLDAFYYADEVYFEMDLDDPANTLGALMFMNMKNGKTLRDLYSPEEFDRMQKFFKDSLKTSLVSFQKMKPFFLEAFMYPKMLKCGEMSGVEQELLKLSLKNKKEVKGFETIAFQSSIFDSIPYEDQAKSLLKTIDSIGMYSQYFDTMATVYKSQQIDRLEAMFNDPSFGMSDGLDIFLDKRNKNWVEQLRGILPKKNIFIAVGAGHLVGKNGLISLLQQDGYTLRALQNL